MFGMFVAICFIKLQIHVCSDPPFVTVRCKGIYVCMYVKTKAYMGGWDQNGSWGEWLGECRLDPVGSG
jgi:hypothetical protein